MVQLLQDDKKPATGWQSVSDDTHAWQQQTWRLIHHWSQPPFPFPFIICVTIGLNRVFGLITITMISCYSWKHVQGRSRKSGYIHYTAKGSFFRQRESVWILLNKWYDRARMVCAVMGVIVRLLLMVCDVDQTDREVLFHQWWDWHDDRMKVCSMSFWELLNKHNRVDEEVMKVKKAIQSSSSSSHRWITMKPYSIIHFARTSDFCSIRVSLCLETWIKCVPCPLATRRATPLLSSTTS